MSKVPPTKEALLEIGSEELPATFISLGMAQLRSAAEASLKENGLPFTSITVYGTPRRLAVVIAGLPERSPDQDRVISGPPVAKGKDASGQWTQAAIGFAAKNGLRPDDLKLQEDRLCAVLKIKGVSSRHLLAQLFPTWIRQLQFPKAMVWEPSQMKYPRPIRWIASLFGSDIVSFSIAGVRSARWTLGLGPWSPKKIVIPNAGKYAILLKNQCVLIEPDARREAIRRYAEQAVKRLPAGKTGAHGKLHISESLLEQVSNLVEHPVAILGNFDPAFLDLPKEVLITCLEHHQKYFPVMASHPTPLPKGEGADRPGEAKLLPHFVGIRNGMSVNQELVREGYERVLAARLADARFFFDQDRKSPLSAKVDALKGVMFQQKLGNLFEKKERVKSLLETIAPALGAIGILEKAKHVADLCKADLVTDMVREFPELQGLMARLYAKADGEEADVAQALEEQYWPITLSGPLPSSDAASMVSLCDKLDTLAGDFSVGLIPTGSADPYGLRRAAAGVLRILEAKKWPVDLAWLLKQALMIQPFKGPELETFRKLSQFMDQRFAALLEDRGFKPDEIDAVLATGHGDVDDRLSRLRALHEMRSKPEFASLAATFKRAGNIVQQARQKGWAIVGEIDTAPVKIDLLKEPAEKELNDHFQPVASQVAMEIQEKQYRSALENMGSLRESLDRFFEGVMVMVDDKGLCENRLLLLAKIVHLFRKVADFSKLQNA